MAGRFDRYADIFEDPETTESIERGRRVLHHEFMENYQASTAREVVRGRAQLAADMRQREAADPVIDREAGE